jgi:hypothetical protein
MIVTQGCYQYRDKLNANVGTEGLRHFHSDLHKVATNSADQVRHTSLMTSYRAQLIHET